MKANVQHNKTSINELIKGMKSHGKYDYLKIILSKNEDQILPKKYLMVTKHGFGLVKLLAVDFKENYIQMKVECLGTGIVKNIHVDVEDQAFRFLLIDWDDIRGLVMEENKTKTDDELLDFKF